MTDKFSILWLPRIPAEEVLLKFYEIENGIFDLQTFAGLSKRCHRIVKRLKTPLTGVDVSMSNNRTALYYRIGDEIKATHYFQREGYNVPLLSHGDKNVKRETLECCHCLGNHVKTALNSFDIPIRHVDVNLFRMPTELIDNLFVFDKCERLEIRHRDVEIANRDLKSVLEQCQATDFLSGPSKIQKNFQFDLSTLPTKNLQFDSNWMTTNDFLNLNCESGHFYNATLEVKDLETIISHWYNSENRKWKFLDIQSEKVPEEKLKLERFKSMEWSAERRSKVFVTSFEKNWSFGCRKTVPLGNGLDIERSDGLLATVLLENNRFILAVWHNRFPVFVSKNGKKDSEDVGNSDGEAVFLDHRFG